MLERASACLDPAVHHLFRRLEAPARSRRVLGAAFWRNRGDDVDVPAWWPVYLNNLRTTSCARDTKLSKSLAGDRVLLSSLPSLPNPVVESTPYLYHPPPQSIIRSRHFTTAATPAQQAPSELQQNDTNDTIGDDENDAQGNSEGELETSACIDQQQQDKGQDELDESDAGGVLIGSFEVDGEAIARPKKLTSLERLEEILQTKDADRRREAWSLFITQHPSPPLGRQVVRFLSSSSSRIDLERALTAYHSISVIQRTTFTYKAAVEAATKLRNHTKANAINREAIQRSRGHDSSSYLFSYYVKYQLWRSAANMWDILEKMKAKDSFDVAKGGFQHFGYGKSEKPVSYWSEVSEMVSLPGKLIHIGHRLLDRDAVLLFYEEKLKKLLARLLRTVVTSKKIMGVITANGILRLFNVYRELGVVSVRHYFGAIATLHSMRHARNRAQLAVLIYRNLRFAFTKSQIPPGVFGSLISICCDAEYPAYTFDILLKEYAKSSPKGKPDARAYQRSMTACARQGDVLAVQDLFDRLCKDYGQPCLLQYLTPLLYAHASVGDVTSTQQLFSRLRTDFGLRPDVYCWNILLHAHARSNVPEEAFKVFRTMTRQGIKPDAYTFGTLMGICANSGDTQALHHFVDVARRYEIPGTSAMIDTLVHSYCLNDEVENAENLAEAATSMDIEGSTTRMWNTILRHYAFQGNSNSLLKTQQRMRELAVKPDSMTYAALMTALVIIGRTKDALQILRSLHFSQNLTATLFHYSIVLHGFAQENDRDMAAVIYHEILERFPRPSASARLAMLHVQSKRDREIDHRREQEVEFKRVYEQPFDPQTSVQSHAIEFLAEILLDTNIADLASKRPQPGFQRRSAREALPSIYMEFLITNLSSNSNSKASRHTAGMLMERCKSLIEASYLHKDDKKQMSIQLLTAYMLGCTRNSQWDQVNEIWGQILALAIDEGRSFPVPTNSMYGTAVNSPRVPLSPRSFDVIDSTDSDSGQPFRSMIAPVQQESEEADEKPVQIRSAQRFILSIPLTKYMQALDAQALSQDVIDVVKRVESMGFALTSKNWNTYIQSLAKSSDPSHQLLAFSTFEEKLLANAPPWPLLRRGKWIDLKIKPDSTENGELLHPDHSEQDVPSSTPVSRRHIEKTNPGRHVPTYTTVIYLGNALMQFMRRENYGEEVAKEPKMESLRRAAPGTLMLVRRIPYAADRIQGVLLRGRKVKGDLTKRPRNPVRTDRAGLLGSKSLLDHIPLDNLDETPTAIASTGDWRLSDTSEKRKQNESRAARIQRAEKYTGQILRSAAIMERTGLFEHDNHKSNRIVVEEKQKLAILEQIQKDAKTEHMVSDAERGEPYTDALDLRSTENLRVLLRRKVLPNKPTDAAHALLDANMVQLEEMVSKQNREAVAAIDIATNAIQAQARNIGELSISSTIPAAMAAASTAPLSRLRYRLASTKERRLALPERLSESSDYKQPKRKALRQLAQRLPLQPWTMSRKQERAFTINKATRLRKKQYAAQRVREENVKRKEMERKEREREERGETMQEQPERLWAENGDAQASDALRLLEETSREKVEVQRVGKPWYGARPRR